MTPRMLVWNLQKRPSMFGVRNRYENYTAFLRGYQFSEDADWLVDFGPWLARIVGNGENLGWESQVLRIAFPEDASLRAFYKDRSTDIDRDAVDKLFDLLNEYLTELGYAVH